MLKWLRKYNTYILVVGGCLLMVAFLLGSVLQDLSQRGLFGGTVMKIGSRKVGAEEFQKASMEYNAIAMVIESSGFFRGRSVMPLMFGGEDEYHWFLLTDEASRAGLVGGVADGKDYLDSVASELASAAGQEYLRATNDFANYSATVDRLTKDFKTRFETAIVPAGNQTRLTEDEVYKAFAKFRGARRLRSAYSGTVRIGNTRLIADSRNNSDTVSIDYVLVPADRDVASIPEPDEAAIKAHFEKFKDTPKGGGDYGIGYKLPARIKIEWLELNRATIEEAVAADEIEVEKRFQTEFPNRVMPDGKTVQGERDRITKEVRKEATDKAMRAAEIEVRAQIERILRRLDRDGEAYRIPADWATTKPDFIKIREGVSKTLLDNFKIMVPAPKVLIRANAWIERPDAGALEGIGQSFLRRSGQSQPFTNIAFGAREIDNTSDIGLQLQVPASETLENASGNKYFFTLLDARKESPPDSIDEVREDVVKNIKRLAAYDNLKARMADLRIAAIAGGLEGLGKPVAGAADQTPLPVTPASVSRKSASGPLNVPAIREKIVSVASALDPLEDLAKVPDEKKTDVVAVDKSLAVAAFRVKKLNPLTVERYRMLQASLVDQVRRDELDDAGEANPFSKKAMEDRMQVKYENQNNSATSKDKDKDKPKS